MSHTLIVFPDDTAQAIVEPLRAAKRSINIRMFLFTDPTLLDEVIAAKIRRGAAAKARMTRRQQHWPLPGSRCATAIRPLR